MKLTIYATVTAFIASLLLAGLAMGSGTDTTASGTSSVEKHMGGAAMGDTSQPMAAQQLDVNQIYELQKLLNDRGYDVGTPDGMIGPSTTAAIQQFQSDNNLASSGNPDQETLRLLSPDAEKQEFFGLAPEYGEEKKMMEEAPKKMGY